MLCILTVLFLSACAPKLYHADLSANASKDPVPNEKGSFSILFDAKEDGNPASISESLQNAYRSNLQDAIPTQLGGIYNGLCYLIYNTPTDASTFIQNATIAGKADAIQAIYMVPYEFTQTDNDGNPVVVTHNIPKDNNWTYTFDNKTGPRNKKLYTAPYTTLVCTDQQGNSNTYNYEYFSGTNCPFELCGIASPVPEAQILPKNYKGLTDNYNERMIIDNFPMCAYATDAFLAWMAQNKGTLKLNLMDVGYNYLSNAVSGSTVSEALHGLTNVGAGLAFGNPGAIVNGGVQFTQASSEAIGQNARASYRAGEQTARILEEVRKHYILPPHAHGGSNNALGIATKTLGFRFYSAHVRPEFAAVIDDYFDRYGYAVHRNVRPNIHSRPHWNYVKTIGCSIHGGIPANAAVEIVSIFDNGITFWKNANEVGNYDLDNRPSS